MIRHKRAVVFANGAVPQPVLAEALLRPDDLLISADGGSRHLFALGMRPHLLVGDLDSIDQELLREWRGEGTEILQFPPEKDATDLELALLEATRRACAEILIIGGLGGRLDHTLANLYLMLDERFRGRSLRMDDGVVEAFWIEGSAEIRGRPGDLVTLLALTGDARGIKTGGLQYALQGDTVYMTSSRGVSNVLSDGFAHITLTHGRLLCLHTRINPV